MENENGRSLLEMSPEELQSRADELCTKVDGDLTKLSDEEFTELGTCCNNYFSDTGTPLQPRNLNPSQNLF